MTQRTATDAHALRLAILELFAEQRLGVLATHGPTYPYTTLVAVTVTNDLERVLFATPKSTRKYANILRDSHVSLLSDNRSNQEDDFHQALALTVLGRAEELDGPMRHDMATLYLSVHPYLEDFITSPTTALFAINVQKYILVRQFQNVLELDMGS